MLLKVSSVKVAGFKATDEKIVKLWTENQEALKGNIVGPQSYSQLFMWMAKNAAWHSGMETYRGKAKGYEGTDLLDEFRGPNAWAAPETMEGAKLEWSDVWTDMFRFVWIPAVEGFDNNRPEEQRRDPTDPVNASAFFKWVMYLAGHYITELKRKDLTYKERARKYSDPLEAPKDMDDPQEGVYPEQQSASGDRGIDELGRVLQGIEDADWLEAALERIKSDRVKGCLAILIKYYSVEPFDQVQARLRKWTDMTWPKIKEMMQEDPDLKYLVTEGLKREPRKIEPVTSPVDKRKDKVVPGQDPKSPFYNQELETFMTRFPEEGGVE